MFIGVYGGIYSATSIEDPTQRVSIEVINKVKIHKNKDQLLSQIKKLKTLKHKNLVKYTESYENEYNIYLVMDSYTGGDLSQIIQKKTRSGQTFSEREARRITNSILQALNYSHSKGIIYGTLRSSDILFDANKEVKIPAISNSNTSGVQFLSSEMKNGLKPTPKSDIWSVGVILHLMLTGRYPSNAESSKIQMKLLDKVSEEGVGLIKKMLDPDQKWTITQLLKDPWMSTSLEEDSICDDFMDSDFGSETSPLKKPQSQPKNPNSFQTLFRFASERTAGDERQFETIETEKLYNETNDATSVITTNRVRHDKGDEDRRQRIMEEILDDSF